MSGFFGQVPKPEKKQPEEKPAPEEKLPEMVDLGFEFDYASYTKFRDLGFTFGKAWLMAVQGVNHSQVENLVKKGCPPDLVFAICL